MDTADSAQRPDVGPLVEPPTPAFTLGTMTDPRDGTVYRTTSVNGVTWMAENLRYLPEGATGSHSQLGSEAYVYHDPEWYLSLGAFYSVSTGDSACPTGWRLPTQAEFTALFASLSPSPTSVAQKLRAATWQGTDVVGFSAVLAGSYDTGFPNDHLSITPSAEFWTSTPPSRSGGLQYASGTPVTAILDLEKGAWFRDRSTESGYDILPDAHSIRCVQATAAAPEPPKWPTWEDDLAPQNAWPPATPEPLTGPIPADWPAHCGTMTDPPEAGPIAGSCGNVTDPRDGKRYRWTNVGGDIWLAQNLDYVPPWGSYCYGDDPTNCARYGRLYEREVAMAACPPGWQLSDWSKLREDLGPGDENAVLRASSGWASWTDVAQSPGNGTDVVGFSALPGGARWPNQGGYYEGLGYHGGWWTAGGYQEVNSAYRGSAGSEAIAVPGARTALSARCMWAPKDTRPRIPVASSLPAPFVPGYCASAGACGTFVDERDHKSYRWSKIGTQVWMSEELNYGPDSSRCHLGRPESCGNSGALYSQDGASAACPTGWHLPTAAEWDQLVTAVGGLAQTSRALKTSAWGDSAGRDLFAFSANIIVGVGYYDATYRQREWAAMWRVAAPETTDEVRGFVKNQKDLYVTSSKLAAVRCLRD